MDQFVNFVWEDRFYLSVTEMLYCGRFLWLASVCSHVLVKFCAKRSKFKCKFSCRFFSHHDEYLNDCYENRDAL